jgi:hypothetical protein
MRYNNDGEFNRWLIEDALETFRNETGKYEIKETSTEFVDFIVSSLRGIASGSSVIRFIDNAIKLKSQNKGRYTNYQIQCIFKTYTNIMIARINKGDLH